MSYKREKPVTVPEYEEYKQLVWHWVLVILDDLMQMVIFLIVLSFLIIYFPFAVFEVPIDTKSAWYFYFAVISIVGLLLLTVRLTRLKRILTYCQVMKKGKWMNAALDDLWIYRKVWPGYAVFYVTYVQDGIEHKRSYRCECLRVDSTLLGIKNVWVERLVHRYNIPEGTTVPIKVYKEKMIVINNDCGFYDLAHCKRRETDRGRVFRYVYGLTRLGSNIDDNDRVTDGYW